MGERTTMDNPSVEEGGRCRVDQSIFPRRVILLCLSILIALIACGLVMNDFITVLVTEEPENSLYMLTLPLMFLHLFGFYFGLISTVYHTLAKRALLIIVALIVTALNVIIFSLRLVFEIAYVEFRPEEYSSG